MLANSTGQRRNYAILFPFSSHIYLPLHDHLRRSRFTAHTAD